VIIDVKILRKVMRTHCEALSSQEVEEKSLNICKNFLENVFLVKEKGPQVLALYRSIAGEVSTEVLLQKLLSDQHRISLPRVTDPEERVMDFFEIPDLSDTHFKKGQWGLSEPRDELPLVLPEELDWMIIPGMLFGKKGERIGRGKGYYDRYLSRASSFKKVGFAFDFQIEEHVVQNHWDQTMDWIVSEKKIISVK
jgi:5-formyltetrahydrofolate cyclo-ligase